VSGTGTSVGSHAGVALRGVSRDDVARARRRVVLNVRRSACVFRGENPRDGAKRSGRGRRGGRSRRTLFLQQGGVFGAGRHHRACSICADEGGGGGSAARTKRRSHDRKRNTRRSHPKQSHASTRWCNARDTDERRMMRRATYPKRRSKRCAREGTPRAVSFRECGGRGWRVGFPAEFEVVG